MSSLLRLTLAILISTSTGALLAQAHGKRDVISLDGTWQIADSTAADIQPVSYDHTVPVPGLVHSATPKFKEVDAFESRPLLSNLVKQGHYPEAEYQKLDNAKGVSHQQRNYFWYRRTFEAPAKREIALIKITKAQFGIEVFLNGKSLGEHYPCFTAAYFDATKAIRWNARNELVVRIGAHPGVLPSNVSEGTDFEKNKWTPGIYDDVSLFAMDNPVIASVQVAPRIDTDQILVETELHNYGAARHVTLMQQVRTWTAKTQASNAVRQIIALGAGETKKIQRTISLPHSHLWSPDDPFLYQLDSETTGDAVTTRFGMREFHFDTVTQRAYLNGKPFFMRGSNITLHRFFEDPDSGTLPWNEQWLQKLLVTIPKHMHWNSFRFCIGPVPDRWLQIADESGLLIQNEYMVWVGQPSWRVYMQSYDPQEMIGEYKEWMRDNWNHPSVVIWDATNESWAPEFEKTIIPAVRSLDLSHRPWENSYNPPQAANDPVEDHQYLFQATAEGKWKFHMTDLEKMEGLGSDAPMKTGHAMILNEYGWLWLNRDGTPTLLTNKLYPLLLGPDSTKEQRFAEQAYLLGGETEFWRAFRRYAGVLQFVYLTASDPQAFTSDNFTDVKSLTLEPHVADYLREAFKPLGIYIDYWHPEQAKGVTNDFTVMMVNDKDVARNGTLRLAYIDEDGKEVAATERPFRLAPLGAMSYVLTLESPANVGKYTLRATARATDNPDDPTISRRWIHVISPDKSNPLSSN